MSKNPRTASTTTDSTTETALELTEIQIWPVRDPDASRVKAMASLTFNGTIRVNGCRLIDGAKGIWSVGGVLFNEWEEGGKGSSAGGIIHKNEIVKVENCDSCLLGQKLS